jgi:hypothetical protein
LWGVLAAVVLGDLQTFGLREKIRLPSKWTIAAQLNRDRAAVHEVFDVRAPALLAVDLAAVYAGLQAAAGVHVTYSGSPLSIIENESWSHGLP